ncbi:MAG: S1 family peptidase [bacterium]|nr:S1 family peptidase [bacterium]
MKRSLLILALTFVFGTASQVGAITFGEPDGNAHPHVGTLLFVQNGVGFFSCTGTLISPTVMLTAGHCTEEFGNVNDVTYVRFDEDPLEGIAAFPTLQDWLDDRWILAESVIPHPQYDDYSQFPFTFDVGLVILPAPGVAVGTYGMLPPEDFLEDVLAQPGNSTNWWTAVGYGSQGILNPFAQDDYARYKSTTRLIELNSNSNGPGASAKFTNNPGGGTGGTCFGDSGGPIFYQDTPIIGAIVSFGITPCIGVDYQFRIDTAIALDFIADNLP